MWLFCFCLHYVIQVIFHDFLITRATLSSFGRNERNLNGVAQKAQLISLGRVPESGAC